MARRSKVLTLLVALAALVPHAPVAAQGTPMQLTGERVRVSPGGRAPRLLGVVESQSADALAVRDQAGTVRSIPFAEVAELERSLGTSSNVTKGLAIGAGLGALAGAGFGLWLENAICGSCDPDGSGAVVFGAYGLAAGGLFGLIVGAMTSGERWERVPLAGREDIALRPLVGSSAGGVALGVSLSF